MKTDRPSLIESPYSDRCLGCWMPPFLVRGLLIEDDDEADDLAVSNLEVVRQNQFLRQIGLVVLAVIGAAHDGVAIMIEDLTNLDGHMVTDHLLLDPAPDRFDPDDLTLVVVHIGVFGKGCHDRVGIKGINGANVFSDDVGKLSDHGFLLDVWWAGAIILTAPVGGESIASLRLDSPVGGEGKLGPACPP